MDFIEITFTSKYLKLGVLAVFLLEALVITIALLPLNCYYECKTADRINLYMVWIACIVLFVNVAYLCNIVFLNVNFSNNTGLSIFVSLLAGVFLFISVSSMRIFPMFWISFSLVVVTEILIFIIVVLISATHNAFIDWRVFIRKQRLSLQFMEEMSTGTSHMQTTYFISLKEERVPPTDDGSGNSLSQFNGL